MGQIGSRAMIKRFTNGVSGYSSQTTTIKQSISSLSNERGKKTFFFSFTKLKLHDVCKQQNPQNCRAIFIMTTLQKIENLLGITLTEKRLGKEYDPNQKNTYAGKDGFVDRLRLDDIDIDDLAALFAITGELSALTLVNTGIPNFADLLSFNAYYLTLDGVKIKGIDCNTKGKLPWHVKFRNMQFDARALRCFENSKRLGFRQVEFHQCHIENIQYISTIPQISNLILDKITFTYEPIQEEAESKIYRMSVCRSTFDHVSFLPFKNCISSIKFGSCTIGSLSGLEEFPELSSISISTDTKVKDKTILQNKNHRAIHCHIFPVKKAFDLEQILPLKTYIRRLSL